jgi:Ku protein
MINKETGNRLKQQMIDAETGDVVESDQKGRGYELKKGQYVEIEKEELEAVQIESNHTIEIDSFVPRDEIDKRYYNHPYYIAPDGKAAVDAFAVIRDAMKDEDRVALARIVLTNREHVMAIEPLGKGLLGTTLRYPYEVRDAKDYFGDLPELALAPDMLALAAQILESKAADFDPNTFQDRYEEALLAHLKAKQAGTVQERKPTLPTPRRVINLMEALRRSVSEDKEQAPPRRGAPVAPARVPRRAAAPPAGQSPSSVTEPSLDRPAPPMIHPPSAMGSRSHERTR